MDPFFSKTYQEARERFLRASEGAHRRESLALKDPAGKPLLGEEGEELFIDVAFYGNLTTPKRVLISTSGVHGAEGFAGSAIQLKMLESGRVSRVNYPSEGDTAVVIGHCINPYGMSWGRRFNEENADINRCCIYPPSQAEAQIQARGTPLMYHRVNKLLNPAKWSILWLIAFPICFALSFLWFGSVEAMKTVTGQDAYPKGIYYGGKGLQKGPQMFLELLVEFFGRVVPQDKLKFVGHIDLHTGLGEYSKDMLITNAPMGKSGPELGFFEDRFKGAGSIISNNDEGKVYLTFGDLKEGVQDAFKFAGGKDEVEWRSMTQEFGTYSKIQVLYGCIVENIAWQSGDRSASRPTTRGVFYPQDVKWQSHVLERGQRVFADYADVEV